MCGQFSLYRREFLWQPRKDGCRHSLLQREADTGQGWQGLKRLQSQSSCTRKHKDVRYSDLQGWEGTQTFLGMFTFKCHKVLTCQPSIWSNFRCYATDRKIMTYRLGCVLSHTDGISSSAQWCMLLKAADLLWTPKTLLWISIQRDYCVIKLYKSCYLTKTEKKQTTPFETNIQLVHSFIARNI